MTLILLDGKNALHRAAAGTGWSDPDYRGDPNAAAHAFVNAVVRTTKEHGPGVLVVVWEGATNWRQREWPAYKANRRKEEADPEVREAKDARKALLVAERGRLERLLCALGVRQVEPEDGEADDALATLATWGRARGRRVVVCTADLDLLQVVGDGVVVAAPAPNHEHVLYATEEDVVQKLGVRPAQVPDLIAIAGDPSDGIPGVRGLGDVAARRLLATHPTVEDAATLATGGPAAGFAGTAHHAKLLLAGRADAAQFKRLAQLNRRTPLTWRPPQVDVPEAKRLLVEMGLRYWGTMGSFHDLRKALSPARAA